MNANITDLLVLGHGGSALVEDLVLIYQILGPENYICIHGARYEDEKLLHDEESQ